MRNEFKFDLASLCKECQRLWEENKDLQGRFMNDLSELQRFNIAINQLIQNENESQLPDVIYCALLIYNN